MCDSGRTHSFVTWLIYMCDMTHLQISAMPMTKSFIPMIDICVTDTFVLVYVVA